MKKLCNNCNQIGLFRKRSKSEKLRSRCNKCLSKAGVAYNKANKSQVNQNNKKFKLKSKTTPHLRYASFKARMGEKVQLSKEEYCNIFKNDPPCSYCGSLIRATGSGLDRIDNSKGYLLENVLPCCGTCNDIRGNNLTVEEMKVAMVAVLNYRKSLL